VIGLADTAKQFCCTKGTWCS